MVRDLIRNQAPGNRLRVRIPCPPLIWPIKTCEIDSSPKIFTGSVSYSCTLGACEFRTPFVLLALSAAHWLQCPGIVAALKRVVR